MRALLNKPIQFLSTAGVADNENVFELTLLISVALEQHPVDMLIFEKNGDDLIQIRSAGYDLQTQTKLDETTVVRVLSDKHLVRETIWFKVDDYGDSFVGTFLYPSEY